MSYVTLHGTYADLYPSMEQEFDGTYQILSEEQGGNLRHQVCDKLIKLYETEELVVNNGLFGHNMAWACQKVVSNEGETTKNFPAWYMMQGIADFFRHCSVDLKKSMQRLEGITGAHRLLKVPAEKQNRYDKVYADMAREVQ